MLLVLGAGGHGKVVADILLVRGFAVAGFLDDDASLWGQQRLGLPILGALDSYAARGATALAMGIGDNRVRARVVSHFGDRLSSLWQSAIHPRAVVAPSVRFGLAVVVAGGAVINPDASVGDFAIVNTGATVDHDCVLGEHAHVAPGVHLSGGARIGVGALCGVGSCVAPGRSVGDWAVVGAGAAVVRDIPPAVTAKGVPARW